MNGNGAANIEEFSEENSAEIEKNLGHQQTASAVDPSVHGLGHEQIPFSIEKRTRALEFSLYTVCGALMVFLLGFFGPLKGQRWKILVLREREREAVWGKEPNSSKQITWKPKCTDSFMKS